MMFVGGRRFFEQHFALGGNVYKQNSRSWGSENPLVIEERLLHPEKLTLWCVLWSEDVIGWDTAQYVPISGRKLPQKNQFFQHFVWSLFQWCSVSHIMSTLKFYNKKGISWKKYFACVSFTFTFKATKWITIYNIASNEISLI